MPVRKDPSGRRYVQAEAEVPGTPEEVWQAIATGPGISSWFVPTQMEERVGGAITANFGPEMDSLSHVTEWSPPHRYSADSRDGMGPDDPTVGTEWIVEARSGGTCVVRVVHSWFASTDEWDAQFEGHEDGWQSALRILRLYLEHFGGQPCTGFQVTAMASPPRGEAWEALVGPMQLGPLVEGQRVRSSGDVPPVAGLVEYFASNEHKNELLLRLDEPVPALAHFFALPMGEQIFLILRFFLYGPENAAVAGRVEPQWQEWVREHFPAPEEEMAPA